MGEWLSEKYLRQWGKNLRRLTFKSSDKKDPSVPLTVDLVAKYCPYLTHLTIQSRQGDHADLIALLAPLQQLQELDITTQSTPL